MAAASISPGAAPVYSNEYLFCYLILSVVLAQDHSGSVIGMKTIDIAAPSGSTASIERVITELLVRSFGVPPDHPPESVFAIQGDSLSIFMLMSLIQNDLSVELDPTRFMDVYSAGPTVRGIANLVTSATTP